MLTLHNTILWRTRVFNLVVLVKFAGRFYPNTRGEYILLSSPLFTLRTVVTYPGRYQTWWCGSYSRINTRVSTEYTLGLLLTVDYSRVPGYQTWLVVLVILAGRYLSTHPQSKHPCLPLHSDIVVHLKVPRICRSHSVLQYSFACLNMLACFVRNVARPIKRVCVTWYVCM